MAQTDESVLRALEQIRHYLRRDKASIMVGAGFSKNADMDEGVHMLDWSELCSVFFKEVNGRNPEKDELSLKSSLRLAQEVESLKGRNALEELITDSLPNYLLSPGYLHELLVKLNWRDIFTTNYDTLLEDAAIKACKHYNVVTSKNSLIYQHHSRIVKLHGSFPDNRPFIITEEDYRTYPVKFPEFINTVRQALIETQFVLIGFSGDDPNFLSWLGWFRDIMGDRMLPVYLIHIGKDPRLSEILLMAKRGIHLIPTAACSSNVREALDFILSFLGDIHTPFAKWTGSFPSVRDIRNSSAKLLTAEMRKVKETYPKWLILPIDRIENFSDTWEDILFYEKIFNEAVSDKEKLNFLYELDWRMSVSFFPKWIEKRWYIKAIEWACSLWDDSKDYTFRKIVYDLSLSLLQIYRQTGDSLFSDLLKILKDRSISLGDNAMHRLHYEEAIWLLQHCRIQACAELLDSWKVDPSQYHSVLWKSRLLKEIGERDKCIMILEQSISDVRRKMLRNASSEWYLSALCILENCLQTAKGQTPDNNENRFPPFLNYFNYVKSKLAEDKSGGVKKIHGFNIGSESTTWHSGTRGYNTMYLAAGNYFQMAEEYGKPIGREYGTFNADILRKTISLLSEINANVAIGYLIEGNDTDAVEKGFSRSLFFGKTDRSQFTGIFNEWLKMLSEITKESDNKLSYRIENVVIPLLAHLSVYAEPGKLSSFADILESMHGEYRYDIREYVVTVYNSLPLEECRRRWWKLMSLPVKLDYNERDYPLPGAIIRTWEGNNDVVNAIVEALKSDDNGIRTSGIERLQSVYEILPADAMARIEPVITDRWDSFKDTNLISILATYDDDIDNRSWAELLKNDVSEIYHKFLSMPDEKVTSSELISDFAGWLAVMIDCCKLLTTEQIEHILEKICNFIASNIDSVTKDDSLTMFGGMHRFWQNAMSIVNIFVARCDLSKIKSGLKGDLQEQFYSLRSLYPLAQSIAAIITSDGNFMSSTRKRDHTKMRKVIFDGICSERKWMINDAFEAALICREASKDRFGMQNIAEEVINRLHYRPDRISVRYIKNLYIWIKGGILTDAQFDKLCKFLRELPQLVIQDSSIDAEIKSDLLYYAGRLVARIGDNPNPGKQHDCYVDWLLLSADENIPADIRKGFAIGNALKN